jgi:hypothetical protein
MNNITLAAGAKEHALAESALDYRKRADLHRPTDGDAFWEAICQLAMTGLTPRDISAALGIGVGAVLQALSSNAPGDA